jgi:hypothetical protein
MSGRDAALEHLLEVARAAILSRMDAGATAPHATLTRVFEALAARIGGASGDAPARVPACAQLAPALACARGGSPALARVADAFARLEPRLTWRKSVRLADDDSALARGYASAALVGPDGCERRDDIRVGVSLMAPDLQFPDHRHPPAEIYLVLSGGEWRQVDGPWIAPGSGGIVYNPPDIVHAMRARDVPLLAIWFLG